MLKPIFHKRLFFPTLSNKILVLERILTYFKQCCYKQNQALSPIICFKPTNTLKTKMALLSPITNYKYRTNYEYANICKGLLLAIPLVIIKYFIGFLDYIL